MTGRITTLRPIHIFNTEETSSMNRSLKYSLLLLPVVVLTLVTGIHANNILNAPSLRWFADDPPLNGTCETIALLAQYQATRTSDAPSTLPTAADALASADTVAGQIFSNSARFSQPLLINGNFTPARNQNKWLIIANISDGAHFDKSSILLLDGTPTNAQVIHIVSASNPLSTCPFSERAALREIALSTPVLALGAYLALLIVASIGLTAFKRIKR